MITAKNNIKKQGFTLVELVVVIVVIGILATVTYVAYNTVTGRAKNNTLKSDITNNIEVLDLYRIAYGSYPSAFDANNCPTAPTADNSRCLTLTSNNKFSYTPIGVSIINDYRLTISSSDYVNNFSANSNNLICPLNFIVVPGSITYGTSDFCVMKYEAKRVSGGSVPISMAVGLPWTSINQTDAISVSKNVEECSGCHLISEAEWMTLSQNVLSVASNWSTGVVGSGYIFSGHSDGAPASILEESTSDSDGYYGTGNSSTDSTTTLSLVGKSQRRTLTLTNGEVIWDLSGNIWEWTSGQVTTGQPGISGAGYVWRNYTALTTTGTLPINIFPSGTGLTGASTWTITNGIGSIYSDCDTTTIHSFIRGGVYNGGTGTGVLSLHLGYGPTSFTSAGVGFRVAR